MHYGWVDIRGDELRNRGVIIFSDYYNLNFAVIQDITDLEVKVIVVNDNSEYPRNLHRGIQMLNVNYTQLPPALKDRLIELSKVRI